MFNESEIQKMVFFDLETASSHQSLNHLNDENPKMADLWSKRCEYLRSRFEENREMSDEQLYDAKAALTPEFSRIICATFGRVTFADVDELSQPSLLIKNYSSFNEKDVLNGIIKIFNGFSSYKFAGHNIKRFDVPMMCKRIIMSGFPLPRGLQLQNLKPWEMPLIDTSDLWSFGAWQESFVSLELLATSLDLPSSKEDIRGDQVTDVFWKERGLDRITKYCEKDVLSVAQIVLKLSGLPIVQDYQLQKG